MISTRQAGETHRETWDHYADDGGKRVRGRARNVLCEEVENLVAYGLGFVARSIQHRLTHTKQYTDPDSRSKSSTFSTCDFRVPKVRCRLISRR